MISSNDSLLQTDKISRKVQFGCLLAASLMEFIFCATGTMFHGVSYYMLPNMMLIPALIYFGSAISSARKGSVSKTICLSVTMVGWFFIAQILHVVQGMEGRSAGLFIPLYLLAFPFAELSADGEDQKGIRMVSKIYWSIALLMVAYGLLLYLDILPAFMRTDINWDGARLWAVNHPNVTACLFMIGIGVGFGFFFKSKKTYIKCLYLIGICLQFVFLALTNCRTSILMTSGMIAAILFLTFYHRKWLRSIALAIIGVMLIFGLFILSGKLYDANEERLIQSYVQKLEAQSTPEVTEATEIPPTTVPETPPDQALEETIPAATTAVDEQTPPETEPIETLPIKVDSNSGQVSLVEKNGQGSLVGDLRTLNGRTGIWSGALQALTDNLLIMLGGTEYVGTIVSIYAPFNVEHCHNSWMEIWLRLGLPGLLLAILFTWIGLRSGLYLIFSEKCDMWKKCIALVTLCLMVAGFLEPFLFNGEVFYHVLDFLFFLFLGYLNVWYLECRKETA